MHRKDWQILQIRLRHRNVVHKPQSNFHWSIPVFEFTVYETAFYRKMLLTISLTLLIQGWIEPFDSCNILPWFISLRGHLQMMPHLAEERGVCVILQRNGRGWEKMGQIFLIIIAWFVTMRVLWEWRYVTYCD